MNKTMKKALSLVLMMIMVISSVPMTSLAANSWCALGHDWGDYVVTTPATCSTKGVETATCKRNGCGETKTRATETVATAHVNKSMSKVEPTCDTFGNEAGIVCTLCDLVISGYEKIPATGHKSTTLAAKAATCTADGNEAGTKCSVCDTTLTGGKKIEKTGHKWTIYAQNPANCVTGAKGSRTEICLNCGTKETKEIEATHNFGAWTTTKTATCTEKGKKVRTCTVTGCNETETVDIDMLGHTSETVVAKEATCTEAGITAGTRCKVCGNSISGAVVIPAKGHTAVVVTGTPATCEKSGTSDSSTCKDCGFVISEAKVIAKLGHNMVKDTAKSKDATCTATGLYVEKCTNTGCTYTTTETLPIIHEAKWETIVEVKCTTDGKRRGTCKKCGMDVTEVVKAEGHKVYNETKWSTVKAATCTEDGLKTAPCSICGQTASQVLPKLGHDEIVNTARVEPTCTTTGKTESKKCTRCLTITVKAETIDKKAHTFGEWTVSSHPTCAAGGIDERKCTACNEKETRTVDRLPHTEVEIPAVAATCTEAGKTAGKKCSVCDKVTVEQTEIAATGHTYVADATASFAPTCELPGRDKGTCSACGHEKDLEIPAKGHTEVDIPEDPADCLNSGITAGKECTECKKVLVERETIPALGHKMEVDTVNSVAANCTADGVEYRQCKNCDYKETEVLAKLEHTYGEWTVTKEASCSVSGERSKVCSGCNAIEKEVIEALGTHSTEILEGKDPTCTTPGLTVGTKCNKCNTILEAQLEIEALGHTFTDEPVLKPATVDADGEYGYLCIVCNEGLNAQKIAKIDAETIKLSATKYYYDGKVKKPSLEIKDVNGNILVENEDYELVYSAGCKAPGKYSVVITFKGNYAGEKEISFTINPVKSAKISYENKNDHILITWDKVVGATGYDIYIYKDSVNGTTRKKLKTVNAGTTSYKLTKDYAGKDLKIGEDYRIGIVSRTKASDGTILTSKNPAFKTMPRKLVKPTLKSVTASSGVVTAQWSNIDGETGYEVVYSTKKDSGYKAFATIKKADVLKATKSLKKGTYYVKVRAYKTVGSETYYSNYSAIKSITVK